MQMHQPHGVSVIALNASCGSAEYAGVTHSIRFFVFVFACLFVLTFIIER